MSRYALSALGIALAASLAWSGVAEAQTPIPVTVEARTGATFPTGDLSDAGTSTGFLFGADILVGLFPRFSLYGGYAWHKFSDDGFGDDITAHGPRTGVKLRFPVPGPLGPWVRGGLSYSSSSGLPGDPDGELGLEFGGGLDYNISPRFGLVPSLHYKTFTQDLGTTEIDLSYLTLDLGARLNF